MRARTGIRYINHGWFITVGPWQIRIVRPDGGKFSNGSKWHSPWYRWADELEF